METNNIYAELSKALALNDSNSSGLLSPTLLSSIISETVRRAPVLRNYIYRQPFEGNLYEWDLALDPGSANSAAEMAIINFSEAKWSQGMSKQSYLYYLFGVSGPAKKSTALLLDVVETRCRQAVQAMARFEGSQLYAGDPINPLNPGLYSTLLAAPTASLVGSNPTLSAGFISSIDIAQRAAGFGTDVIVVSPAIYAFLANVAYDRVRFINTDGAIQIGYSLSPSKGLQVNGTPCVMDPYCGATTQKTGVSLVHGTGNNYSFTGGTVKTSAGTDFAGTSWTAPVITASGATVPASAYAFQSDGSVTFNNAVTNPTASYFSAQNDMYFLSLNPADLMILESEALHVLTDLPVGVQQDVDFFRAQQYSSLVVRNQFSHVLIPNVTIPASTSAY